MFVDESEIGDIDLATVKSRAVKGMATLTGGGVILAFIQGVGVLLITTFLGPKEFGLFGLIGGIVIILSYFSDIGLAASLIQKKEALTKADLQTTFTIQQVMVLLLIVVAVVVSPLVKNYYNLAVPEMWLYYALLFSFFLSSLKSIPSVMLERSLRFDRIMLVRIVETVIFNVVAVTLAIKGFGISSYVPAILSQGLAGLFLIYAFKSWPIGLAFSKESLQKLLKFGIPYQTNSLLAVAKDQVINLFLWKIVGAAGMGYVNWGFYYSQQPQSLIIDNATKVAFPAVSRMQDNPAEVRKSVEKLLKFICLIAFPMLVGIALTWSQLAFIFPKWFKWQPALIPLYLFCFSAMLSCLSTPLTNILYALGKAKVITYLMVMWLVLEWSLKPILAMKFGFVGITYAAAIIALTSFVPFFIAKKIIGFSIWRSIGVVSLATGVMVLAGLLGTRFGIVPTIVLACLGYTTSLLILGGRQLLAEVKPFYDHFRAKI